MSRSAELMSLGIFAGLMALFIADKAEAIPDTRADHETRMVELGQWQPPTMKHRSYQRIHPNGLLIESNVPQRNGRLCEYQRTLGEDGAELIRFEVCGEK